jgi:uncharacterized protein (TIGR03435 family)
MLRKLTLVLLSLAADGHAASRFEVISIKPCKGEPAPVPGRKGSRGGRVSASPGRLTIECATLRTLVRTAYIQFAEGRSAGFVSPRTLQQDFKGSPGWLDSDRFTIEAKAETPEPQDVMRGPMLQALLEERFGLKVHKETHEVPIYELRVAKGGPKFPATKPGSCQVMDRDHPPPEPIPGRPMPHICGAFFGDAVYGMTMAQLALQLTVSLDRDVVDKTDLAGEFDIHFVTDPPEPAPAGDAGEPGRRNTMAAMLEGSLPRLGLRLESARAPGMFLVIDRVEKPEEN